MTNTDENKLDIIEYLFELFAQRGADEYMGENVSMAQHMEQTAACAVADNAADHLVVAALLHDVGQFLGEDPIAAMERGDDNLHDETGADFLAAYFSKTVTEPIRLHVVAKRYLSATDKHYLAHLSAASVGSLNVQGGPMNAQEMTQFEANPYHQDAVQLRIYDDDGKVEGLTIKSISDYRAMLEAQLLN